MTLCQSDTIKPLVRWTIGPVNPAGFKSLKLSISFFKKIYKGLFDYVICHNTLNNEQLDLLASLETDLFEQGPEAGMFPPLGVAWKLYPPRLRKDAHEIFIDNDLIVLKQLPQIEKFLSTSDTFIYTESPNRFYGQYKYQVPEHFKMNSGLFGLPPRFDLKKEIMETSKPFQRWTDKYDEQGLLATIFSKVATIQIPLSDMPVCGPRYNNFEFGKKGYHFVLLNAGFEKHWLNFNKGRIL